MKIPDFVLRFIGRTAADKIGLQEGTVENKKWYASKTVWAGVIAVLVSVYNSVGTDLAPVLNFKLPPIPDWVFTLLGAMGVYGRLTADKKIQ